MEVFGNDLILGNFRLSDYGLMLASFTCDGESEDDIGYSMSTIETFVGNSPIPIYLGEKHSDKLKPSITICKNPCLYSGKKMSFSEKDCRELLRILTGFRGYQWMKIISDDEDNDIWFRCKINKISYKKVSGDVVGLIFEMECDSYYGYSVENIIRVNAKANKPFYIFNNTDDLQNYVFPRTIITPSDDCDLQLLNKTENWATEIKNVKANEKICIDSKNEILSSSVNHSHILNDFNLQWTRLLPNKNEYVLNVDATVEFIFRTPRKVGIV